MPSTCAVPFRVHLPEGHIVHARGTANMLLATMKLLICAGMPITVPSSKVHARIWAAQRRATLSLRLAFPGKAGSGGSCYWGGAGRTGADHRSRGRKRQAGGGRGANCGSCRRRCIGRGCCSQRDACQGANSTDALPNVSLLCKCSRPVMASRPVSLRAAWMRGS